MAATQAVKPYGRELPAVEELEKLVQEALAEAKRNGASTAEASAHVESGLSVNVRMGSVDTLEHQRDRSLGVAVYFGHRKGAASSADFSSKSIRETVQAACDIARYTSEDPCQGLADADLMAREIPDLDLYHPWSLSPEAAIEFAKACEAAALAVDSRIGNSEGASLSSHSGVHVYGNSHGFVGGTNSSRHSLSCVVVAQEGDRMQRDYWYSVARDAEALDGVAEIGRKAAERALARLGSRRVATARVPVVFSPEMARGLLGSFVGAIRGGSLYRKASFLVDSLGRQIFPGFVRMEENPLIPRALGSAAFDGEGVATRDRLLVDGGVLQGYVLDSYSARKLKMQTTGNAGGIHNLIIDPGDLDRDGLLREIGRGLLVTEMMGHGINMVTGDYSRGAAGFWVENGEIAFPVEEITVAGNLKDMFMGIRAVGNDVDRRGSIHTGSMLVEGMTVAGE